MLLTTNDGSTLLGAELRVSTYYHDVGGWDITCLPHTLDGLRPPAGRPRSERAAEAPPPDALIDYIGDHLDRLPVVVAARVGRTLDMYGLDSLVALDVGEEKARLGGVGRNRQLVGACRAGSGRRVVVRRAFAATARQPLVVRRHPDRRVGHVRRLLRGAPHPRALAEPAVVVLAAVAFVAAFDRRRDGDRPDSFDDVTPRLAPQPAKPPTDNLAGCKRPVARARSSPTRRSWRPSLHSRVPRTTASGSTASPVRTSTCQCSRSEQATARSPGCAARHDRVHAVEPSAALAAALADVHRGDDRIEISVGTVHDVLLGARFGSAVLFNVLEHIEDDADMLRSIRDRLVPRRQRRGVGAGVRAARQPLRPGARPPSPLPVAPARRAGRVVRVPLLRCQVRQLGRAGPSWLVGTPAAGEGANRGH